MKERGKQYLHYALSIYGCEIQGRYQDEFQFLLDYHLHCTQYCNSFHRIIDKIIERRIT